MLIGNNIHTNSNKKTYRKPILEVVKLDSEIIIMGASGPDTDPGGPGGPGGLGGVSSMSTETTSPDYGNYTYKENTPFGGSTPDYER